MYQLVITKFLLIIGSGIDFDSNPINIMFAAGEVSKPANISLICDKTVEGREKFDIRLTLTSNNPLVRTGRDRSAITIRDSTGNDETVLSMIV